MKKILTIAALSALAIGAQAQTSTNQVPNQIPPAQNFLNTASTWLTSLNPDNTWTNVTLEVGIGYEQVTGAGATSVADAQYDIGQWNVGAAIQYFGVGSAINVAEAQVGYAVLEKEDLKIDLDVRFGYDFNTKDEIAEPGLFLKKKLTTNTYAEAGVSLPFEFKSTFSRNPTFFVETGVTF
jgi:hypothetical protein